jgi:uncharacterized protein GlcG (DUF336 family)
MLSPEIALDSARAALAECRKRGYQVAVAVVDRFGVTQVMLRDRFAGAHTPADRRGKAWTAASFRTDTSALMAVSSPACRKRACASAGSRHLGGGMIIEAEVRWSVHSAFQARRRRRRRCLRQGGLDAIRDRLDF